MSESRGTTVRRGWRRLFRRRSRGQTLAEFALVAPVFFILIFGIVDMARMVQSYVTIQAAAREGARYGVTGDAACDLASPTRYDCIVYVTETKAGRLENKASLDVDIRSWAFATGGYASTPTANSAGIQCDNLEVSVSYDYKPMIKLMENIIGTVELTASERLVNEPFGACGT